jgi:peptide/nickel transport system ATP-binding protein
LDEPTTALDVVVQREILRQIFDLRERLGFSVLFITHDLSLLLEVADRVVIMYAGRLVEAGTREPIHRRAAHPYTRGLLGSFPRLRGPRQKLPGIPGSPPDLRGALTGCPFIPRCRFSTDACSDVDMRLLSVHPTESEHVTACPFVTCDRVEPTHAEVVARRVQSARAEATIPEGQTTASPALPAPVANAATAAAREPGPAGREDNHIGPVVLEASELDKQYRLGPGRKAGIVSAVHGVSLALRRGAIVALVGESGSGKTTVARLLAGQERRSGGEIRLDGKPIDPSGRRGFRAYKSEVQVVFQDPFASLNPLHTVRYHLERALRLHRDRTGRGPTDPELDKLLTQVRLTPPAQLRDAYPHELSGGQRQRVAIARALAASPRVLLTDEPVSMLDVSIRLEMLDLIEELRPRLDLAVLYITHDIALGPVLRRRDRRDVRRRDRRTWSGRTGDPGAQAPLHAAPGRVRSRSRRIRTPGPRRHRRPRDGRSGGRHAEGAPRDLEYSECHNASGSPERGEDHHPNALRDLEWNRERAGMPLRTGLPARRYALPHSRHR